MSGQMGYQTPQRKFLHLPHQVKGRRIMVLSDEEPISGN